MRKVLADGRRLLPRKMPVSSSVYLCLNDEKNLKWILEKLVECKVSFFLRSFFLVKICIKERGLSSAITSMQETSQTGFTFDQNHFAVLEHAWKAGLPMFLPGRFYLRRSKKLFLLTYFYI